MKTYKQFMFHFQHPVDSIDARVITDVEKAWCRSIYEWHIENKLTSYRDEDSCSIEKLFKIWFPEELL